jgi:hypothetical protein
VLDRTLLVNPFNELGFLEIRIVPGELDPDMVDSTDVVLRYEHAGSWARDKVVTVRPGGAEQLWKLRLSDPARRSFSYRFVHRLKDGTTSESRPVETDIPSVTVNDPYDEPLVAISFDDPGSTRTHLQQIEFGPTQAASRRVRFARTDSRARAYVLQLTILGNDNSVRRLPPVRLDDTIVFLGEQMAN